VAVPKKPGGTGQKGATVLDRPKPHVTLAAQAFLRNGDNVTSTLNRRGGILLAVLSLLVAVMAALGATSAGAATRPVQAGSATPGVPTSTVGVLGEHGVRYCVKNYAPNTDVTVVNQKTGQTVTIHTNSSGAGCAEVPIERACRAVRQVLVASGTDALGNPASSQSVVTAPATPSLCAASGTKKTTASGHGSSSGSLAFTGAAGIALMIVVGLLLIGFGTAAVVVGRRRRSAATV
jgi:hypothetical protein